MWSTLSKIKSLAFTLLLINSFTYSQASELDNFSGDTTPLFKILSHGRKDMRTKNNPPLQFDNTIPQYDAQYDGSGDKEITNEIPTTAYTTAIQTNTKNQHVNHSAPKQVAGPFPKQDAETFNIVPLVPISYGIPHAKNMYTYQGLPVSNGLEFSTIPTTTEEAITDKAIIGRDVEVIDRDVEEIDPAVFKDPINKINSTLHQTTKITSMVTKFVAFIEDVQNQFIAAAMVVCTGIVVAVKRLHKCLKSTIRRRKYHLTPFNDGIEMK